MKKLSIFLVLISFLCPISLFGQSELDIRIIEDLHIDERDQDAKIYYPVKDWNNNLCALIKVSTTHPPKNKLLLDVGGVGLRERVEKENGEIWFYVPATAKNFTFSCHEYKKIPVFSAVLKPGAVYRMKFDCVSGGFDPTKKQQLEIRVYPADAQVEVDGMPAQQKQKGVFSLKPLCGTHTVQISAENYHPQINYVILTQPDSVYKLNVALKQNFGWLVVNGEGDETITIRDSIADKKFQMTEGSKFQKINLKSGSYDVMITKPFYKSYITNVVIEDSIALNLSPQMVPNYKDVVIQVPNNAEIYVNKQKKGNGSWSGRLEYGFYDIEARLQSHESSFTSLNFTESSETNIKLDPPQPIYGILKLNTNVSNATISIEPKPVIKPLNSNDNTYTLLVGTYKVKVEKPGYKSVEKVITINKNATVNEYFSLSNIYQVSIVGAPYRASIYVDGQIQTGTTFELVSGEHVLDLTARGYRKYHKKINVTEPYQTVNVKMAKRYYYPDGAYMTADYLISLGGESWGGLTLGGYWRNINFEFGYQMLFSQDEPVYWHRYDEYDNTFYYYQYDYSANLQSYKVGYGIIILSRLRVTPQIGINYISVNGKLQDSDSTDSSHAFTFPMGGKLSFAISPSFDFYVGAEYQLPISMSDQYQQLYDSSSRIKDWTNGLRISMGLGLFF